ncbi:MAG TPA: MBOAT family O-acyltransferase [Edaphobacter sp.]|nr:MBOAT family O-acyltransferase [Edaphobacter sp.]
MLFNSPVFLFAFLPIAYFVFWALKAKQHRHIWLTLTGYVFYGWWNPKFCLVMLFSTLVSYLAGLGLLKFGQRREWRRALLIVPIAIDLSLLGYFKYCNLGITTWNWVTTWSNRPPIQPLDIILPLGISFYTFHTITYIVDSYRGVITPTRSFWEFACYVSLFSQLVAGPIVRFRELQGDLEKIDTLNRSAYLNIGFSYFVIGITQKVLLADTVASIIDPALKLAPSLSTTSAWLCMLGYTYQLYFDFAGYSNMAVGLGYLFGMHIPQNFNSPYKALNPSDFWGRWHISLSRCLKDYLYIPLGGNRKGDLRTYSNLMLTMLLGGLWHGASWTFVFWGAYHGALLCFYKTFSKQWDSLPKAFQRGLMFTLVVLGWTVFRADSWVNAVTLLNRMLIPQSGVAVIGGATLVVMLAICALIAHLGANASELKHEWHPLPALAMTAVFVICIAKIVGGEPAKFLYFQF